MYDKINFVYHTYNQLGCAYFGTYGLEKALRKLGRLHYSFNSASNDFVDENELRKYPILYMRGHVEGRMPLIEAGGSQFKATYQSESYYTRHGKLDESSKLLKERSKYFDLIFTCADTDLNVYNIPTIFCSPWVDTNVIYPMNNDVDDDLIFIGNKSGREDFFKQDIRGLIKTKQTVFDKCALINTKRYNEEMSKHLFLINPPGRYYNGICGRAWEIMGAGRLCFQYFNPDTMQITGKYFKDNFDLVYFSSMEELYDKYDYYKNNKVEAMRIANQGWRNIVGNHNELVRAKFISDTILQIANAEACVAS